MRSRRALPLSVILFTAGLPAVVLGACSSPTDLEEARSDSGLIGGTEAWSGQYRGVIKMPGCTAAKVGPRTLLTAAHCVYADDSTLTYVAGSTFPVKQAIRPDEVVGKTLTVESVSVHPSYADARTRCTGQACWRLAEDTFDIAVIRVREFFSDYPVLPVSNVVVRPTASTAQPPLNIVGFGCEDEDWSASYEPRLKFARVRALPRNSIEDLELDSELPSIYLHNVLTNGWEDGGASLCPADSGGPLMQYLNGRYRVVGVNSYYSFETGSTTAKVNWHARLSGIPVVGWLHDALIDKAVNQLSWRYRETMPFPTKNIASCFDGRLYALGEVANQLYVSTSTNPRWVYVTGLPSNVETITCAAGRLYAQDRGYEIWMLNSQNRLERMGAFGGTQHLAGAEDNTVDFPWVWLANENGMVYRNTFGGIDGQWRPLTGRAHNFAHFGAAQNMLVYMDTEGRIYKSPAGSRLRWQYMGFMSDTVDMTAATHNQSDQASIYVLQKNGAVIEGYWE